VTIIAAATAGLSVYIDALPVKNAAPMLPADTLIKKASDHLKQKHGIDDYRLVDFGKGTPLLVLEFSRLVDELPRPVALTVSSRTPEGSAVLSSLVDRADIVIKGVA
jgi:hypothetical protein